MLDQILGLLLSFAFVMECIFGAFFKNRKTRLYRVSNFHQSFLFAKLSQAKPQLQLSWLALASLNFT